MEIRPITFKDAAAYVNANHRHYYATHPGYREYKINYSKQYYEERKAKKGASNAKE